MTPVKKVFLTSIVSMVIFGSSASMVGGQSTPIPPSGTGVIYGKEKDFYKCWDKKVGTKAYLQVKDGGTWKTVAQTSLRRNRGLCPNQQIARYIWTVDRFGFVKGTKCGVTEYIIEFREYFPADKSIGTVWSQTQWASEADHVRLITAVLDKLIKGIDCGI